MNTDTPGNRIKHIEEYVRQAMAGENVHDYGHVKRVTNWALKIAKNEGFPDLDVIKATALLHDIGRTTGAKASEHGLAGSEIAKKYLSENALFSEREIADISHAIRFHNSNRHGSGILLDLLRDADIMDALGAIGILRAVLPRSNNPVYNPENIKGETWEAPVEYFDERFDKGLRPGDYLVDEINLHISYYNNLRTKTAKRYAKQLVLFMKNYVTQLEFEAIDSQTDI